MSGVPVALRRRSLFRFGEEELRQHEAELFGECEASAAAHRRAAGLPGEPPEDGEELPLDEEEPADEGPGEDGAGRAGPASGPIVTLTEPVEAADEEVWIALESRAGYKRLAAVLVRAAGVEFLHLGDRGVVRRRGEAVAVGLLGTEEPQEEDAPDSRILEIPRASDGGRVDFRQAVAATSVSDGSSWAVKGPRTTDWVLQRIAEQGPGPVHRHYWWRSVFRVTPPDSGADNHLFMNELIETAMCADRLNVANIQAFEMVLRRLQLWEEVYGQQLRTAENGDAMDPWLDERSLFLVQRKSRWYALVAPQLEAWVAQKLAEESVVMKERRKGREERLLALGMQPPGGGSGSGAASGGQEARAKKTKGGGKGSGVAAAKGGGGS